MKILYFVRHAKAISADVGVTDFKRALAKTGRNDARAMGRKLRQKGIKPELFISSPADRALETAHIFAKKLGYPPKKIWLKEEIYDEDAEALEELIKEIDDTYTTVMFFGHNPSVSDLARVFLPDLETDIQVSGILGIAFETSRWQDISAESATLRLFDFPMQITPKIYKKARRHLTAELTSTIEKLLGNIDAEASKPLEKIVRKTSKQLAKKFIKGLPASKVEEVAGTGKCIRIDNLLSEVLQTLMTPSPEEEIPAEEVIEEKVEETVKEIPRTEVPEEKVEEPAQEPLAEEKTEKKIEEPPKERPTAERSRRSSSSAKKTTGTKKRPSKRRTTTRKTTARASTKKTT